ncbi:MAG: hypothetical protein WDN27_02350 [Candidatus Saccharibacteria bacterium]
MGLKWLSHTLSVLLFVSLSGLISLFIVSHTLLNAHYIEGQLQADQAYSKLSVAISAELAKDAGTTDPQVTAALQNIVTPTVLQQKINSTLDQLQAFYLGNGPAPQIDVSDLVAQAQAAGVPVPANSNLSKPITLGPPNQNKGLGRSVDGVRLKSLLISGLLLVALLAVCWKRRRYTAPASVLIAISVLYGLLAAAFLTLPSVIDSHIRFDFSANAFAGVGHDLALAIAKNLGRDYAIVAIACLVVGIVSRMLIKRLQPAAVIPTVKQLPPTTAPSFVKK